MARSQSVSRTQDEFQTPVVFSVVVPVHNERENLPQLLDELQAVFDWSEELAGQPYEIIFVEDGSDDGTDVLIDKWGVTHPQVRAVHLARSWGQSAALAAGFESAEGEIVISMDGDLQNDPADIPQLVSELDQGFDCVSGNRADREDPLSKTIPSAIQTRLAKLLGPDINDFGCTLKAYRAAALDDIDLYGEEHRYIPAQLYDRGYAIGEVDVNHRPRPYGQSRYGLSRLLRGFSDLIFHLIWNRYSTRPFHLFGGSGLIVFTSGSMLGIATIANKYLGGQDLLLNLPELLLSVGMVLFGLLLLMFGVILQYLTRLYYRDRSRYRIERVVE